VPTGRGSGLA